jgi:hypothetical protein
VNDGPRTSYAKIREARPIVSRRRLRLIHAGRLLTAGTLLHGWLASLENKQLNSTKRHTLGVGVLESQTKLNSKSTAATAIVGDSKSEADRGGSDVWIHCSIGQELPDNEGEEDRVQVSCPPLFSGLCILSCGLRLNIYHTFGSDRTAQPTARVRQADGCRVQRRRHSECAQTVS